MARKEVLVQLSDELLADLDAEAERSGRSRSAVLREAAASYLRDTESARVSESIIEGYRRVPQGEKDAWGNLEAFADLAWDEGPDQ